MDNKTTIIESLRRSLPPVFSRELVSKQLGGLLCAKTFSNLDASGFGPSIKVKFGKKIGYERDNFLAWLNEYLDGK